MPRIPSPVLSVRELSLWRETPILERIQWEVARGEHWVILGANGSGKTSLLRAITGYFSPSAGEISLLGEQYGEYPWQELRRRIGWISASLQQQITEQETAWEVVAGGPRGMINTWGDFSSAEIAQAIKYLRKVNCVGLQDRPWRQFSQGERQRVLMARALATAPALLILDEPCAGLDPVAREHFLEFLRRLARRRSGPPILLVTHHVEEIIPEMTHVLMLREGKILAQGPMRKTMTEANLSDLFGSKLRLRRRGERYQMALHSHSRTVF